MKYLNNITRFLQGKKSNNQKENDNKNVQYFIDIINSEYNLGKIEDDIFYNKDRYDLNISIERVYEIAVYQKSNSEYNTLILNARYTFWKDKIQFSELDKQHLINCKTFPNGINRVMGVYDNRYNCSLHNIDMVKNTLQANGDFAYFKISLVYESDEPHDIILESFNFLISKYGFKFESDKNKIYQLQEGRNMIVFIKYIDPDNLL